MPKIKRFDRQTCRTVREQLDSQLAALARKLGLKITVGSASFNDSNVTFKVECAVLAPDGTAVTKQASDFQRYAHRYALAADDLNRSFRIGSEIWTLVGLLVRSRKAPFVCRKQSDGKCYKMSERDVRYGLSMADREPALAQ